MKASQIFNEDGWWTDKAKKAGLKVASKFSDKKQGQLNARNRATALVTAYKEALGAGLSETGLDMAKWLTTGTSPVSKEVMQDAQKKSGVNLKTNSPITIAQARDFYVAMAGSELRGVGTGATSKAREKASSNNTPTASEPITMDNLASAIKSLKADDGRFI